MQFEVRGTVLTGQDTFDYSIQSLELLQQGSTIAVFANSGPNGGLASYNVTETGSANLVDSTLFNPAWATGNGGALTLVEDGTTYRAIFGATGSTQLGAYAVGLDGTIGTLTHLSGLDAQILRPNALHAATGGELMIAGAPSGFACYEVTGAALSNEILIDDDATMLADSVGAMAHLQVAGSEIFVVASAAECGVTSYRVTASGPVLADSNGPDNGLGIMRPTDLATASVDGADYVIIASAQDANGALSVLQVASDGTLTATDHIIDTRQTRFGAVQVVEAVTFSGRTYVIAGGGDDGLSLFVLLPGGVLQLIDTIEDTNAIGLTNIADVVAAAVGNHLRILAASGTTPGLTDLAVNIADQGIQHVAASGGQTFSGGDDDDILIGGNGNDTIGGGAGDDILVDGAGHDTLTGGDGRDVFVLRDDSDDDIITDFNPAYDRLDLSAWPMFHDPASLTITATTNGANINWRDMSLSVRNASGGPLSAETLRAAVLTSVNRPVDLSKYSFPADQNYDLAGTDGDDILHGGDGAQIIAPGLGNDIIWAGEGDDTILEGFGLNSVYLEGGNDIFRDLATSGISDGDTIHGGAGDDQIYSGAGHDQIDGGEGTDHIESGDGDDRVFAGSENDTVQGGPGDDVIEGQLGNDVLLGQEGADQVSGGDGNDEVKGGWGDDNVSGGNGDDLLAGNLGHDHLDGGAGKDRILGHAGNDTLLGGSEDDIIYAGWGDDIADGGAHNDIMHGQVGEDELTGGSGDDYLNGGPDDDILDGQDGDDRLNGGRGTDTLFGGTGNDRLEGRIGDDIMHGGDGTDLLLGWYGADKIYGGAGDDELRGANGLDELHGGDGRDKLLGGNWNDKLYGDNGNDRLVGNNGNDILTGGEGVDRFVFFSDGFGKNRITDYDPGIDHFVASGLTANDATLSDHEDGLEVTWGNVEVVLEGLSAGDFDLGDIDFV